MGIIVVNKKIGFCCKFVPTQSFKSPKEEKSWIDSYNVKGTTVTALKKLSYTSRVDRVLELIHTNIQNLKNQFELMGTWEPTLRMLRIGSDVLPAKTHPSMIAVYKEPSVIKALQAFEKAGDISRKHDIRLSTHPGQFTLLCTNGGQEIIDRSIQDLEYHADVFRLLGYDSTDLRQEINIHGGARRADFNEQFLANFKKLSTDLQNWLSVENDEFSYSLDDLLPISDKVKICLDIHHYWIHHGTYIDPRDTRLEKVIASWRGVVFHLTNTAHFNN
jgi:UV DNA damage repair endonuclease